MKGKQQHERIRDFHCFDSCDFSYGYGVRSNPMKRRHRTTLQRTKIFLDHGGICHLCSEKIDAVREGFELEHVIALELSLDDSDENLRPAHKHCHRVKTSKDAALIAKAKRIEAKHLGGRPKSNWPSRKFGQRYEPNVKFINGDLE